LWISSIIFYLKPNGALNGSFKWALSVHYILKNSMQSFTEWANGPAEA
jgi:hypothetical protein